MAYEICPICFLRLKDERCTHKFDLNCIITWKIHTFTTCRCTFTTCRTLLQIHDLIHVAESGSYEDVKMLLEKGADVSYTRHPKGLTALIWATIRGHLEIVKLLLERGASASYKEFHGNTALMLAATFGHLEIMKLLTENE